MTGIETWNIISPVLFAYFVEDPKEYQHEAMDIYLKVYFALKELDKKEKKESDNGNKARS